MKNQAFKKQPEAKKRRKLEIVLRRLTNDRLTARQRRLISAAVGCHRQCRFRLCQKADFLPDTVGISDDQTAICPIFGNTRGEGSQPAAVLVRHTAQNPEADTVYIYLPKKKEEQGDDTRKKETDAQ